jgi:hypothetical protein
MHKAILRTITILAALAVSGLAVSMAVASARQRAVSSQDQLLLAALGVVFVLAVHLLPALMRGRLRLVMWPVWLLCLALAGFGHASWFYLAGESAAEVRQAGSAAARAAAQERADIEQALSTIKARPLATVAAQLARTNDLDRREALALELAEAKRAANLRNRLIEVAGNTGNTVTRRETAGNVGETLRVTGGEHDIMMVVSVVAALLVELLGALLWSAALRGDDDADEVAQRGVTGVPAVVQQVVNFMAAPVQPAGVLVVDEVADLRAAIARGECRGSVRGIREYLSCRMETATRLKRALEAVQ